MADKTKPVYISKLLTHKNHRRRGHARTLLLKIIKRYSTRILVLKAAAGDFEPTTAQLMQFYNSLGFMQKPATNQLIRYSISKQA